MRNKININDVGVSKQLIDWRKVLKSAICKNYDWSYKNASIENGIITPHLEEIFESNTEILLDTSGSIDDDILKSFLRECKHIFNTSKIKVGCFDTKFYGFQDIKNVNDIDKLNFVGGGGTDFSVAIESFSSRVDNKIIFTDGRSFMPNQYCNCIWVVFGDKKIDAKEVLDVITSNINCGDKVSVEAEGPDEEQAVLELVELIETME